MITDEERQALDRLSSGTEEEAAEAAAVLAHGRGDEVDRELLELFEAAADWSNSPEAKLSQKTGWHEHAELISRILAERDPDRDPSYLDRLFDEHQPGAVVVAGENWGFTRLRRLEPVQRYADQLRGGGFFPRLFATISLGDTVDPAAFDVLLPALSDRRKTVRGAAVQSVQRLAQSGLEDAYSTHAARQRLADMLLTDRRLIVRVLAARVLCLFGDEHLVVDALSKAPWWRPRLKASLKACLSGGNPPLQKMWIGER
jgi:hypothetical protein